MSQSRAFSWRKAVVRSELNGECRHLLLTLSLYMNEMGQGAYPTLETLAKDCGKSLRWAKKWMKVAVDDGWIRIEKIRKYTENSDNRGWKRNEYFAAWPDTNVVIDDEVEVGNSDPSLVEISDEIAQGHYENGSAPDAPPSEKVVHEKQKGGARRALKQSKESIQ